MKNYTILLFLLLMSATSFANSPIIQEAAGWFETVWVKWTPVDGADKYNVYFSGEGVTNKKIDDNLIRNYGGYYRADIPGLKAGSYTVKIAAVVNEVETATVTSGPITAMAHDRAGFAFANNRVPGAYKADGTPKDGAVILYITQNTKNTVSCDVVTDSKGKITNYSGLQNIFSGVKKGYDTRPFIIRLIGNITDFADMEGGDIVVENKNNESSYITIEGIGDDATANGWGIRIKNASNIEIRNLAFMNVDSNEGDNIGLQQSNDYIWVHHTDMFYGQAGSDSDQVKGDGALDCKGSTYVTFAYNHFWDSGKACLLGLSEGATEGLYVTYHHNWFDHSDSRHPRVRFYSAHVYNNYYDGNSKYGVGSTNGSSVFVEGNYYRNCKYPMMISMQGTDVYNPSTGQNDYKNQPTFSKEDGGIIKAYNNHIEGAKRFVAYGNTAFPNPTVDFDAYVVNNRNDVVPPSVKSDKGGNSYNNFDTNGAIMYSYSVESPEQAKMTVEYYAGRIDGGDFKWTFNNSVDDNSYDVIDALKQAVTNYSTSLVSIQGDGESTGTPDPDPDTENPEQPGNPGDMEHNFTVSGKTSTFYSIDGSMNSKPGTVNYNGLTLTQCLKIESSTKISFTLEQAGTLILVFNDDFNNKIIIDDVNYTASNGRLTVELSAGNHTITKGDTANLYYMNISVSTAVDNVTSDGYVVTVKNNHIYLSGDVDIQKVEIYNVSGRLVKVVKDNFNTIDVADLSRGVHIIKIYNGKQSFTSKFVKR